MSIPIYPGYSSLVYVFTKQSAHAQFDKCTSAVVSGLESLPTMVTQFIESFNVGLNEIFHVFLCPHDSDTPVEFSCLTIITFTTSVAWTSTRFTRHPHSKQHETRKIRLRAHLYYLLWDQAPLLHRPDPRTPPRTQRSLPNTR